MSRCGCTVARGELVQACDRHAAWLRERTEGSAVGLLPAAPELPRTARPAPGPETPAYDAVEDFYQRCRRGAWALAAHPGVTR